MLGSITADVLQKRPVELAVRAMLAFGLALWLSTLVGPSLLEGLLRVHEQVVHLLDDHYRIELALTHQTGHDTVGSDLVLLGHAVVTRTVVVFGGSQAITLVTGQALQSSTAIGILMQPAIMILGFLLGWPVRSGREALVRGVVGAALLALWLVLGIPLSLWIYFQAIPLKAYAPNEFAFLDVAGKFLLNGGSVALGTSLAFGAIATTGRQGKT
jgi:hypothetical protein